jgi:TonB-dependent starch-binding outer membrane protein SusC
MASRIKLFALFLMATLAGASALQAQERTVSGTVVGPDQAPVSGATVTVTGSRRGVQTDAAGRFTISLPAGEASISVTRIGFTSRTVPVPAGQNSVNVRLNADVLNLEAVVVTGQATAVRRENLANAVSVVTAENLQRAPAQTVESALQGKIAGASISANSGAPGGGIQIALRGVSTISGNPDPLFIIDGVLMSNVAIPSGQNAVSQASRGINSSSQDQLVNRIADINPNDIESIEVLKGASAAAIYGARAANGVVIIRTKRGRAGPPQINFTQRFGYFEQSNKLGSREWSRAAAIDHFDLDEAQADLYFLPAAQGGAQRNFFDNEETLFGGRHPARYSQLSLSGGNENTRYYIAGTLQDDAGLAAHTGYEKQAIQLNLDQALGSRVTLGIGANVTHSVASRGLTGNDNAGVSYYAGLAFTPSFISMAPTNGSFPSLNDWGSASNPAQTAALGINDENVWRAMASANLQATLMDSERHQLRLVMSGGVDYFQQRNELYYPPELFFEDDDQLPGTAILGVGDNTNLNWAANLVHRFSPSSASFTATSSVGMSYTDEDLKTSQVVGRNTAGPIPTRAAKIEVDGLLNGGRARVRDFGVYAQEELLLLDERATLTGGIRAERSSNNSDQAEYFLYPKVSASYRFDDLMPRVGELKLRVAYGSAGNRPLYGQRFTPALTGVNIEGHTVFGINGSVGAADLHPERTTELEGGFDAVLFDGRARLEVTGYNKTVSDFIIAPPVAPSTGYGLFTQNSGSYRVQGLEVGLEGTPIQRGNLTWLSRGTFATDRAEVTDLGDLTQFNPGNHFGFDYGGYRIREGLSPTAMWGERIVDGSAVETVFGDANHDYRIGFANDVTVGRFQLSSLVDYAHGGLVANLTRSYYEDSQTAPGWEACNDPDSAECEAYSEAYDLFVDNGTYIEDATYFKLRELGVAYSIPTRALSRFYGRVRNARISVSARNIYTWSHYTGLDPEVSNFGNRAVGRNQDVTPFPPSRSFWLSFDLGF